MQMGSNHFLKFFLVVIRVVAGERAIIIFRRVEHLITDKLLKISNFRLLFQKYFLLLQTEK